MALPLPGPGPNIAQDVASEHSPVSSLSPRAHQAHPFLDRCIPPSKPLNPAPQYFHSPDPSPRISASPSPLLSASPSPLLGTDTDPPPPYHYPSETKPRKLKGPTWILAFDTTLLLLASLTLILALLHAAQIARALRSQASPPSTSIPNTLTPRLISLASAPSAPLTPLAEPSDRPSGLGRVVAYGAVMPLLSILSAGLGVLMWVSGKASVAWAGVGAGWMALGWGAYVGWWVGCDLGTSGGWGFDSCVQRRLVPEGGTIAGVSEGLMWAKVVFGFVMLTTYVLYFGFSLYVWAVRPRVRMGKEWIAGIRLGVEYSRGS
ncbi:hypothetical protein EJ06DRAFT_553551 [Trichodelitschia bisporula]|uniref:Uncharacterized protein n=1 Tax=Trichodelitschia bisporula TaxID=703511 RepID=A0A6G1I8V2_9PEZI|nr:hypothetical protein EJ06DRAFT_553551 [Trichodelitschia bisporula]